MQGGAESPQALPRPQPPRFTQRVAYRLLALAGWRVNVQWPPEPRGVMIVYPHTSNWDFVVGIVVRYAMGLPVRWVGKDTLFSGPLGGLFKRWGGIPVNRRQSTGFIGQLQEAFAANPWLWIVITPEGTRSHSPYWKSGFYHLALAADVPVGLAYIDFGKREVGLRDYIRMTGDVEADLDRIRAVYADKVGHTPANAGEIRFRDDDEDARPDDAA